MLEPLQHFFRTRKLDLQDSIEEKLIELDVIAEWRELKIDIKANLIALEDNLIMKRIFTSGCYPNLTKLYKFLMVFHLSTVECERTFSAMNQIKTDLRNSMANQTLDSQMTISLLASEDYNSIEPICEKAIEIWKKARRT